MRSKALLLAGLVALLFSALPTAQSSIDDLRRADVNQDGVVDSKDIVLVRGVINKRCGQVGFLPRADVNGDCIINNTDLAFVQRFVGQTVPQPPTIQALATPARNANGWNNSNVTVSFTCTNATSCPAAVLVSTEGANQIVNGTATGPGGSASASATVNLDKTAPSLQIETPANNSSTFATSTAVHGAVAAGVSPLASVTCNGVAAALNGLQFDCTVTLQTGANTITATATDRAGNSGNAATNVTVQTTPPPTITAAASPAPNAAGWNNTNVVVTFTCTNATTCPAPVTVSTEGIGQVVNGTASGPGGAADASVTLQIDKTAPVVQIASPADNSSTADATVAVHGSLSAGGSAITSILCNATPATVASLQFDCTSPLQAGANTITVVARDAAGNQGSAAVRVSRQTTGVASTPVITFTSPLSLSLFNGQQTPITVAGTVDDPSAIVTITSPESPTGVSAGVSGNSWQASNIPLREGHNLLNATARNAQGGVGTATLTVTLDTTAPIIRIDGPAVNALITNAQIAVTGVVNDIVPGTVNSEEVHVTVNGLDALVSNRSFVVPELLLARGSNTLTAVATDRAGNLAQTQIQVTLQDNVSQQRIAMVSGDQQSGAINTLLAQPLVVRALDGSGAPLANRSLTFRVVKSDGVLRAGDQQGQEVSILSDDQGRASAELQLGSRSGVGNNQVSVIAAGFAGAVTFSESSTVGLPAQINAVSGQDQRGPISHALSLPFAVVVYDSGGNPVPNVPIIYKVVQGGGSLVGNLQELSVPTNSDGKADVLLTLGTNEGVNNNVVAAGFGGDPTTLDGSQRVTFQASGLVPGDAAQTRISGVVLDNADKPIPNATATIVGTNLVARTDAAGHFSIGNASTGAIPIGTVTLIVDGSTTTRPETFPFLAFVMNTVAGTDNTLGMPIYIPPLDINSAKLVGGDDETVLTMDGVPGVAFTIAPHSTILPADWNQNNPTGSTRTPIRMMLSQVHADKVPMPPPNGSAPSLVWTLQPAGVHFDPPIQVQLPNTDGLAPGQVVEIYQFDHDLEQFVATGPGRVSPDGSIVVSDKGFGITKSGWGAPQPPPPPKNCTASCNDNSICTSDQLINPPCTCQNTPTNEGASCGGDPGKDSCKENGKCAGGACAEGTNKSAGSSCNDNIFCSDPDQCDAGGACKGTKIEDKEGPNFTFEAKFGDIQNGLKALASLFGSDAQIAITGSVEASEKDICCEAKQQKDVPVKKAKVSFNAKLETPKIFVPSLSFDIRAVRLGVFVKFGVSAAVAIEGENDFCEGNGVCWKGGITLGGSVEGGVAAEDAAKIVSISASCVTGLQFDANVSCKEYQIALSHSGFKCKINVELFDGFVAFGVEKELIAPGPLIGSGPKPLPSF